MANDDTSDDRNHRVDPNPVAKEEIGISERLAQHDPTAFGRAVAARSAESASRPVALGLEASRTIARIIESELARFDDPLPTLAPLPTDVRLARLERDNSDLKYAVYALFGLFFFLWLVRR